MFCPCQLCTTTLEDDPMATRVYSDRTSLAIEADEHTRLKFGNRAGPLRDRFPGGAIDLDKDDVKALLSWLDDRGQRRIAGKVGKGA